MDGGTASAHMGRWLGALFLAGGLGALICIALPHWKGMRVDLCLADASAAVLIGLAQIAWGDRLRPSVQIWMTMIGTAIITIATYGAGGSGGAATAATLYTLVALYAGAMFSFPVIVAELGVVAAAYAAALSIHSGRGGPAQWLAVMVISGVIAGVTAGITRTNRRMALHDSLTALPNRRALDESLRILVAAAGRRRFPLSVSILDLDRFKQVNAELGHQGADDLLVELVGRWKALVRPEDLLARYGGDEFVLLLPDADLDVAIQVVERLAGIELPFAAFSAGVAMWDGDEDSAHLLRRADAALFEAKDLGRGRVVAARTDPLTS